jgi:hypothetical protein
LDLDAISHLEIVLTNLLWKIHYKIVSLGFSRVPKKVVATHDTRRTAQEPSMAV